MAKEKQKQQSPPKKTRVKKIIIILICLAVIGGGGFAGYLFFFNTKGGVLPHVNLDTAVMAYTYSHMPDVYTELDSLNTDILLIDKEIARIQAIAKKYPDQQKITDAQIKQWESILKEHNKAIDAMEKTISEIYVSYRVDPQTGETLIQENKNDLIQTARDALNAAKPMTDKLKEIEASRPFWDKLLEKVGL